MSKLYVERFTKLNHEMKEQCVDCVLICNSPNLFYMTGYSPKKCERLQVALVPVDSEPIFIVPSIYAIDSERDCFISDQRVWFDGDDILPFVKNILKEKKLLGRTIAIDNSTEFSQYSYFMNSSPDSVFRQANPLFSQLRKNKSPEELNMMRESGILTDKAINMLVNSVTNGKSEIELHNWIEYELGSWGMRNGFSNLIASGPNTSSAHHVSANRIPKKGDAVYFDIGGGYNHYWSDSTRTIHIGKPDQKFIDAYKYVREAQQLAAQTIRPGIRACDVNFVAHQYLDKCGLGEYFTHRVGHGIGLEGHETPNLSSDENIILEPGMTFTCEPGVYIKGEWGIRIEDTVVVTETGCESFNHHTKDLIVV